MCNYFNQINLYYQIDILFFKLIPTDTRYMFCNFQCKWTYLYSGIVLGNKTASCGHSDDNLNVDGILNVPNKKYNLKQNKVYFLYQNLLNNYL